MMCNVSPAAKQFEETLNTLKYAARAKKIKTRPVENKKMVELHIAEYKNIIQDLRKEITDLRNQEINFGSNRQSSIHKHLPSSSIDGCPVCFLPRPHTQDNIDSHLQDLSSLFQEQLNLRKEICEIEVQNRMNRFQIFKEQELAKTGVLEVDVINLSIANLEKSVHFNANIKNDASQRLVDNIQKTEQKLAEIQEQFPSEDSSMIIDELVKMKMVELENLEAEGNLRMYEQVNNLLMVQIKKMQMKMQEAGLGLCSDSEDEREEYDGETGVQDDDDYNNLEEDVITDEVYDRPSNLEEDSSSEEQNEEDIKEEFEDRDTEFDKDNFTFEAENNRGDDSGFGRQEPKEEDYASFNYTKTFDAKDNSKIQQKSDGNIIQNQNQLQNSKNLELLENEEVDQPNVSKPRQSNNFIEKSPNPNLTPEEDPEPSPIQPIDDSHLMYLGDDFDEMVRKEEIREMEEMGFDMGQYQGTVKDDDSLNNTLNSNCMISQAEVGDQIRRLESIPRIEVEEGAASRLERSSTLRFDTNKGKSGVDWNLVINWGEESKIYNGDVYPESSITLEGDMIIRTKDFEDCLDAKEMAILRNLELGDSFVIAEKGENENELGFGDDEEF